MAQNTARIPTFYRVAFLYIDPLIAGWGAYLNIFDPAFSVNAFVPASIAPYNALYGFLQHQLAAALVMCIILDIFLLRKTNELWIWDPVQAGQLLWDVTMIVSQFVSIRQQGRLTFEGWRGEDWGSLIITAGVGLVRTAFLTRVGMRSIAKRQKKN